MKNAELFDRAEEEFDVLLTMDQGLEYQQNLEGRELALVTIVAPTKEYEALSSLVPELANAIRAITNGEIVSIAV